MILGVFGMAGNANSGFAISFSLSEEGLRDKIESFRREYADGSRGIVTWPRFCAHLGYSVAEVRECYQRGKAKDNAYSGRAALLDKFRTEVAALTMETGRNQVSMAKAEADKDYFTPPGQAQAVPPIVVLFGCGDGRYIDAIK